MKQQRQGISAILTCELEAEVTAIYRELQNRNAEAAIDRDTMGEQSSGPRLLTICFLLVVILLLTGVPAWILAALLRSHTGL